MTAASGGLSRTGARLVILLGVPLLIWVSWIGLSKVVNAGADSESRLRREAANLQESFDLLLDDAADVAGLALQVSPSAAYQEARQARWRNRLEGVGILDAGGWVDWEGTPAEPATAAADRTWHILVEGQRVRLVYTTAASRGGLRALVSFVLDTPLDDLPFARLLPRGVDRRVFQSIDFLDARREHGDVIELFGDGKGVYREVEPATLHYPLRSPTGEILALVRFQEVSPEFRSGLARARADSAAVLSFTLLLALLFRWRAFSRTAIGLPVSLAAIAVARMALLGVSAPAHLLPRLVGSPSIYGSPRFWGLFASPADLLLTAVACLLAVLAVREFALSRAVSRRGLALILSTAAFATALAAVCDVSVSLARDASIPLQLLERVDPPLVHLCLLGGLASLLVATAESVAVVWVLATRRTGEGVGRRVERVVAALSLVGLAALSTTFFANTTDRMALERLRTEFMPQVLDQSARRSLALRAFIASAAERESTIDAVLAPPRRRDDYAAYHLWAGGELFRLGYQSSLDLYDADGNPISRFGFDLPPLTETIDLSVIPEAPVVVREAIPQLSVEKEVLHAEMPVVQDGIVVGAVVGHVLDEPDNLPFLPAVGPYLAALGPGAQQDPGSLPDYVLFDDDGNVVLSSLDQPPALTADLVDLASRQELATIEAGGNRYIGYPRRDGPDVHLLLIPARPLLDRFAVWGKLLLVSLVLLAVMELVRSVRRHRGVPAAFLSLGESFYRKLLAAVLVASLVPLVLLALVLMGYVESRAETQVLDAAAQVVRVVQRVIQDYAAIQTDEPTLNDDILDWVRDIVDQDIHIYENGKLVASSKRELFTSGLLPPRLPGEVHRRVVQGGLPYLTLDTSLGPSVIPVAYADVALPGTDRHVVAAVPLILQKEEAERAVERIEEMLFLSTVLLAGLLVAVASMVAGTVSRPVRELVAATGRIAEGDYSARLDTRSRDEVAELVEKFNVMAAALADQRADLVRRRDYMEALLLNATTGVVSTDDRGRIVTLNPAAADLLDGTDPPRTGEDLVVAISRDPRLEPLARALEGPPAARGEPVEVDLTDPAEARRLRFVRVDLPDPAGGTPGSLVLLEDVTDMMRSNQLAAWAEMARAIAHEIKNPLTPIQLSTEHLEQLLRDRGVLPSPEVESCLQTVIKQVQELRDIASEFSSYAKLPAMTPEPSDPAELMHDAIAPYRAAPPPGVAIVERYDETPAVTVDRRVMTRAIVNLVENAIHAMPDGGTLTLGTAVDERGGQAVLVVEDTGIGISPEVRTRLFEPYFSTKSSGAGLGLAIVRRAVEAHGGTVELDSDGNRGTVFRILLPVAAQERA
jgi:signal transduction histidine kinase